MLINDNLFNLYLNNQNGIR